MKTWNGFLYDDIIVLFLEKNKEMYIYNTYYILR